MNMLRSPAEMSLLIPPRAADVGGTHTFRRTSGDVGTYSRV